MVTNEELKNMSDEEFYETARAELKGLPRSQRRAKERELKENIKLMKSFSPAQLKLIEAVTSERAKLECEQQIERYITIMDTCLSAYMYLKDEDITEEEVLKEIKIIDDLVTGYRDVLNNIYLENRGNDEMSGKQIEKVTKEVREKCEKLIKNGMNQSKALVILESYFPAISKAMLVNAYKKVKKEMKETIIQEVITEEEKQVIDAAEYIFPEIKEQEKEGKQEQPIEPTEEVNVIASMEEERPIQAKSKLKIVSKCIKVEGEFGKYEITNTGVDFGDLRLKSMDDVKAYEDHIRKEFEGRIAELKEVMSMA